MTLLFRHLTFVLLASIALVSQAEQRKTFANYDVHYSTFTSAFIDPQVAKAYDLVRGDNHGIVNIAIRERMDDGSYIARRATVTGSSTNLIHRVELDFKEVVEQNAIYYIAEFEYDDKDMRHFDIKVQPDPKIAPYRLKFSNTFYND
jgi:hypothetical protein